jgi:hypothetical protein
MLQSSVLIDALSSACWEGKKDRNVQGAFFPGQDMSCWLNCVVFLWLLGAIKGLFS